MDEISDVDIDDNGRFKYILVKIKQGSEQKYIVRGYSRAAYHGIYCIKVFIKLHVLCKLLYCLYFKIYNSLLIYFIES